MNPLPKDTQGVIPLRWLKYVPVPLFILDRKGKISYCNDGFVEMTGYMREEILGASLDTLVGQESLKMTLKDILNVYEGKSIVRREHDLLRKSGTRMHVVMNLTPIYGEGEEGSYVVSVIGMIMEYKELG